MSSDAARRPLAGRTVAITADRKGADLRTAFERLGAEVVWGSTVRAVAPEVDRQLVDETATILAATPAWFAVSTGSGLRAWLTAAHTSGQGERVESLLHTTRVVARGAKSHGALRSLGVEPVYVSAEETMDDVCAWLTDRLHPGDALGAQVHGGEVIGTLDALRARCAAVHTVAPYRWALPDDLAPARAVVERILAGGVDVLAETSAPSARHLFVVADRLGRLSELVDVLRSDAVCVASVGPVTARAFDEVGVAVDVMPTRGRTADLLRAVVHWATVTDRAGQAAP